MHISSTLKQSVLYLVLLSPVTPQLKASWGLDVSFKDEKGNLSLAGIAGIGLAAAAGAGLASWLLSETDEDVLQEIQQYIAKTEATFSALQRVYTYNPLHNLQQKDALKTTIERCEGGSFYLLTYRDTLARFINNLNSAKKRGSSNLATIQSTMSVMDPYDKRYSRLQRLSKEFRNVLSSLENLLPMLEDTYYAIGSWPEYAYQLKKHKKFLKQQEEERRQALRKQEAEQRLREQQREMDRLNNRINQLEREQYASQKCCVCYKICCSCGY